MKHLDEKTHDKQKNVHKQKNTMLRTFLSVFIAFYIIYGIEAGALGKTSSNKMYVNVDAEFTIDCEITNLSAAKNGTLAFYDKSSIIPEVYVKKITNRKIQMKKTLTKPQRKNYTCKLNSDAVDFAVVFVDYPPGKVNNFKCRTSDLNNLTCSFTQMKNLIPIVYKMKYRLNDDQFNSCNLRGDLRETYMLDKPLQIPQHDFEHQTYHFLLTSTNKINQVFYETFTVSLLDVVEPKTLLHVIPEKANTTSDSAVLKMIIPKELIRIKDFLEFEGLIHNEYQPKGEWTKIDFSNVTINATGVCEVKLIDLPFPNTNHNVKIRVKSKTSQLWSNVTNIGFKTEPNAPTISPAICSNCFSLMNDDLLFFYWKNVPKKFHNGKKFQYSVVMRDDGNFTNNLTLENYITWHHVNYSDIKGSLQVDVYSKNRLGLSSTKGSLKIPALNVLKANSKQAIKIKKEFVDKKRYNISWKILNSNMKNISGFTVLWCESKSHKPNQCEGPTTFVDVPTYQTEWTVDTTNTINFAISIKSDNQQLGLEWAECTSSRSDDIGKITSMWSEQVSSMFVNLQWKPNCQDEFIIAAYKIKYCIVETKNDTECVPETEVTEDVPYSDDYQHTIKSLYPYKLYKIQMALISTSGRFGSYSNPLYLKTAEGVPTSPRNLQVLNVTNSSVFLTWMIPTEVNGPMMTYQLSYNAKIENNITDSSQHVYYELKGLDSSTKYDISVTACTSSCSIAEKIVTINTQIGNPNPIRDFSIYDNHLITWERPKGPVHFYQIMVEKYSDDKIRERNVYRIMGDREECTISMGLCATYKTNIYIRSINLKDNSSIATDWLLMKHEKNCFAYSDDWHATDIYESNWTNLQLKCPNLNISFSSMAVIIILLCIIVVLVYSISIIYKKYKRMKNIKAYLPSGLIDDIIVDTKEAANGPKTIDLLDNLNVILEEEEDICAAPTTMETTVSTPFISIPNRNNSCYFPSIKFMHKQKGPGTKTTKIIPNYTRFMIENNNNNNNLKKSKTNEAMEGYMKMYSPVRSHSANLPLSTEGYLDMTKNSNKNNNSEYTSNDFKRFINEVHVNNDGYIGKRKSINPININSKKTVVAKEANPLSGYVQLPQLK